VLLTLGANLPTGGIGLDDEEFEAARVLAAPALALSPTAVGSGAGGLAGVVVARQALGLAWALAGTYERRGRYQPVTASVVGGGAADYRPGDALHLSVAADRATGASTTTVAVTADLYGEDALTLRREGEPAREVAVRLGPTVSAEWQLRLASPAAREVTLYAVERYRAAFRRAGATVAGSSGHQLAGGAHAVLPAGDAVGVLFDAEGQYHTGLAVDASGATVAAFSSGATLGLRVGGPTFAATPFVRARYGVFGSDERVAGGTFLGAGLSIAARF
jgi:hypothetical protein